MDWKEEAFKRLDAIAAKLGVAADHLWSVLVKQAYIEAVTSAVEVVMGTVFIVACVVGFRYAIRKSNDEELKYSEQETWEMVAIIGGVVALCICGIVFFAAIVPGIENVIQYSLNPEYFALHKLAELLK